MTVTSSTDSSVLFTPLEVGRLTLSHRIVLAPLTRSRATKDHVHTQLGVEYYSQRSAFPGSLLITEGTVIHPEAGAYSHVPYIYTDAQVQAWKRIVDSVHANGSHIFLQLWAFGRAADVELLKAEDPNFDFVGASAIPISPSQPAPRPLTVEEIKSYVQWYADAAVKAINQAGFDGVELHFANGYLPDQFLQDTSNQRTDEYGGSAKERFPDLAYLHVVDDRVSGDGDLESSERVSKEFLRQIWGEKTFIAAGGYTPETAAETVKAKGGLVAFGRHYIANPDLPLRIKYGVPLNKYQRSTFYTPGPRGYTDYPATTLFRSLDVPATVTPKLGQKVSPSTLVTAA